MNIDENVLLNVDADTEGTEFGSSTEDAVIKIDSNEYLMNQILKLYRISGHYHEILSGLETQ